MECASSRCLLGACSGAKSHYHELISLFHPYPYPNEHLTRALSLYDAPSFTLFARRAYVYLRIDVRTHMHVPMHMYIFASMSQCTCEKLKHKHEHKQRHKHKLKHEHTQTQTQTQKARPTIAADALGFETPHCPSKNLFQPILSPPQTMQLWARCLHNLASCTRSLRGYV